MRGPVPTSAGTSAAEPLHTQPCPGRSVARACAWPEVARLPRPRPVLTAALPSSIQFPRPLRRGAAGLRAPVESDVWLAPWEFLPALTSILTQCRGRGPEGAPLSGHVPAPAGVSRALPCSYVSLCDNEKTGCKARELKSVYVDAVGQFLKLILHQNHANKYNVYNQVRPRAVPRTVHPGTWPGR